jgi:hypothetical protein
MGRRVWLGLFVLAAVCASSCDTEQPLQIGEQDGMLTIRANGAGMPRYFTWLVFRDNDGNNVPDDVNGDGVEDDNDKTLWCELDNSNGIPNTASPFSVPWTYSLKVSVLRAGQTTPELLTSTNAIGDTFNRAPYDESEPGHALNNPTTPFPVSFDRGECSGNTDVICNPNGNSDACERLVAKGSVCEPIHICDDSPPGETRRCDPDNVGGTCQALGAGVCTDSGTCSGDPFISCEATCGEIGEGSCVADATTQLFKFDGTSRRALTMANRELLESDGNILYDLCSGDADCLAQIDATLQGATLPELGLCPGRTVGEPALDPGNPNSGVDSLSFDLDAGDTLIVEARRSDNVPSGGLIFINPASISARLFIDGVELSPNEVNGSLSATDPNDPAIFFSYTSQ